MKRPTVETTQRGRQQEASPLVGIGGEIYISTLNWPSLGITPDAPEYGLRTIGGPLAFSRSRDALVEWARLNYIDVNDDDDDDDDDEPKEED
jgi:hypothetical protein